MSVVLLLTGIAALAIGAWRGYLAARLALGPLIHDGDPTRTLVEAGRPVYARSRVRTFARHVAVAIAWLAIGMYGILLLSVGADAAR
jgi:hypothetical protein